MARPNSLNGGRKQVFPASQRDYLEDMKALDYRIEQVEASIARLTSTRDRLQNERYQVQEAAYQAALSHAEAISGAAVPLCRAYCATPNATPAA